MVAVNHVRKERSPFSDSHKSNLVFPEARDDRSRSRSSVKSRSDRFHRSSEWHRSRSPDDSRSSRDGHRGERNTWKLYDTSNYTAEFWERRRNMRERAGETSNHIIWPPSPEKQDSDEETADGGEAGMVPEGPEPKPPENEGTGSDTSVREGRHKKNSHRDHRNKKRKGKSSRHRDKKREKRHRTKRESSSSSDSESQVDSDDEQKQFIRQMKAKKREIERRRAQEEEEIGFIGPVLPVADHSSLLPLDYGRALLPGEGAAMAAYIAEGKRIPRRGEIGLTSDEIEKFECQGYVMSGSRHRRMEAVRLRKENQIYSADEKRALEHFNYAERAKREAKLQAQFKALIKRKLEDKQSSSTTT